MNGTTLQSVDKRLEFNVKPLTEAFDDNNKLEPVEYDQTQDVVDNYMPDTPHSHQCGFKAQSVQQNDQLIYAVVGGEFGEDGKEAIRPLNNNAILTYAVKAIKELSQPVKAQQLQIDELKQQLRTAC